MSAVLQIKMLMEKAGCCYRQWQGYGKRRLCERSQCGSLGEYGAATSVFYWTLTRESVLDAFYYRFFMKLRWHHWMLPRLEMLTFSSPYLGADFGRVWHSRHRETCCVADFARLYSSHHMLLLIFFIIFILFNFSSSLPKFLMYKSLCDFKVKGLH